jgi:hypothetical protein
MTRFAREGKMAFGYNMVMALFAALAMAAGASAEAVVGERGPDFELMNISDSTFVFSAPRPAPTIVMVTHHEIGDFSRAWRDSLRLHVDNPEFHTVLDMGDVSSFLRFIARSRIRDKGTKAFIDWDGEVSEEWRGEDRSKVYLYGVTPDGVVRFVVAGTPSPENVQAAVTAFNKMRTEWQDE